MRILGRSAGRRVERLLASFPVVLVYTGQERRSVGSSIELLPWDAVARGEIDLPL